MSAVNECHPPLNAAFILNTHLKRTLPGAIVNNNTQLTSAASSAVREREGERRDETRRDEEKKEGGGEMEEKISACEQTLALLLGTQAPFQGQEKYTRVMEKLGRALSISCVDCSQRGVRARGFLEVDPLAIKICADRVKPAEVQELLDHELVHAFDYSLKRCDFSTGLGLAYSEVRAAREAECSGWFLHEYFRTSCIKDHATRSTQKIFSSASSSAVSSAAACVEEVYERAMKDMEPYHSNNSPNKKI